MKIYSCESYLHGQEVVTTNIKDALSYFLHEYEHLPWTKKETIKNLIKQCEKERASSIRHKFNSVFSDSFHIDELPIYSTK